MANLKLWRDKARLSAAAQRWQRGGEPVAQQSAESERSDKIARQID
jgi:hypothetical protein